MGTMFSSMLFSFSHLLRLAFSILLSNLPLWFLLHKKLGRLFHQILILSLWFRDFLSMLGFIHPVQLSLIVLCKPTMIMSLTMIQILWCR
jgi:hypothetical protein